MTRSESAMLQPDGSARRRRPLFRAILVALSLGATLLALEVCLRVRAASQNSETLERAMSQLEQPTDELDAGLGNIIRLSANDTLIYELQPKLVGRTYHGARVTTDERGFRIARPPQPRDPGALTILGIGDSIQFGDGVEDGETYLAVLHGLLEELQPARRWRVVNTAVPGYNTVMEVETLRSKALDLEPDLVILNVVSNDFAPPKYVRNEEDPFSLGRSYLLDLLRGRLHAVRRAGSNAYLEQDGPISRGKDWWEIDSDGRATVPEKYRHVFGQEAFRKALDELAALAAKHGFEVLVFSTYTHPKVDLMLEEARARGFPCLTLMDELVGWLRERKGVEFNEKNYSSSALVVSRDNTHPSPLQHRMAAYRILRELDRVGMLARLLAQE